MLGWGYFPLRKHFEFLMLFWIHLCSDIGIRRHCNVFRRVVISWWLFLRVDFDLLRTGIVDEYNSISGVFEAFSFNFIEGILHLFEDNRIKKINHSLESKTIDWFDLLSEEWLLGFQQKIFVSTKQILFQTAKAPYNKLLSLSPEFVFPVRSQYI